MSARTDRRLVVVDGSNLATEGRSKPSLAQLSDAVTSYMEDHQDVDVTVVVDATFGHRIDSSEVKEYDAAVANNELVAPPAGAVGRGDAFVLGIADKSGAVVLSNDSFQEVHGQYDWLFDEGRLVGGKPVPHVGWVFVDRVPVRGPVSRKATGGKRNSKSSSGADSQARSSGKSSTSSKSSGRRSSDGRRGRGSAAANEPMPVPTSPPPGARTAPGPATTPPRADDAVNDLMPFLDFVEHHPVGTSVNATVESYSSHGAYVAFSADGVRGYIPLRLMADPPPRSARKVMSVGEALTVVVVSYAPARRSIDCALPDMAAGAIAGTARDGGATSPGDGAKSDGSGHDGDATPTGKSSTTGTAAQRRRGTAKKSAAKQTATKKSAAKKSPAKRTAAKKAPAKKSAAKEGTTARSTAEDAPVNTAAARKSPTKKSAAKKSPAAKKPPAKQSAAKKAPAKRSAAKKSPAKQSGTSKRTAAKRTSGEDAVS
jgi:hypothetical protein